MSRDMIRFTMKNFADKILTCILSLLSSRFKSDLDLMYVLSKPEISDVLQLSKVTDISIRHFWILRSSSKLAHQVT